MACKTAAKSSSLDLRPRAAKSSSSQPFPTHRSATHPFELGGERRDAGQRWLRGAIYANTAFWDDTIQKLGQEMYEERARQVDLQLKEIEETTDCEEEETIEFHEDGNKAPKDAIRRTFGPSDPRQLIWQTIQWGTQTTTVRGINPHLKDEYRLRAKDIVVDPSLRPWFRKHARSQIRNMYNKAKRNIGVKIEPLEPDHPAWSEDGESYKCVAETNFPANTLLGSCYAGVLCSAEKVDELDAIEEETEPLKSGTRWAFCYGFAAGDLVEPLDLDADSALREKVAHAVMKKLKLTSVQSPRNDIDCWSEPVPSDRLHPAGLVNSNRECEDHTLNIDAVDIRNELAMVNDPRGLEDNRGAPAGWRYPANLAPLKVWIFGVPHTFMYCLRDVREGEELLIEYGQDYWATYERKLLVSREKQQFLEAERIQAAHRTRINQLQALCARKKLEKAKLQASLDELKASKDSAVEQAESYASQVLELQRRLREAHAAVTRATPARPNIFSTDDNTAAPRTASPRETPQHMPGGQTPRMEPMMGMADPRLEVQRLNQEIYRQKRQWQLAVTMVDRARTSMTKSNNDLISKTQDLERLEGEMTRLKRDLKNVSSSYESTLAKAIELQADKERQHIRETEGGTVDRIADASCIYSIIASELRHGQVHKVGKDKQRHYARCSYKREFENFVQVCPICGIHFRKTEKEIERHPEVCKLYAAEFSIGQDNNAQATLKAAAAYAIVANPSADEGEKDWASTIDGGGIIPFTIVSTLVPLAMKRLKLGALNTGTDLSEGDAATAFLRDYFETVHQPRHTLLTSLKALCHYLQAPKNLSFLQAHWPRSMEWLFSFTGQYLARYAAVASSPTEELKEELVQLLAFTTQKCKLALDQSKMSFIIIPSEKALKQEAETDLGSVAQPRLSMQLPRAKRLRLERGSLPPQVPSFLGQPIVSLWIGRKTDGPAELRYFDSARRFLVGSDAVSWDSAPEFGEYALARASCDATKIESGTRLGEIECPRSVPLEEAGYVWAVVRPWRPGHQCADGVARLNPAVALRSEALVVKFETCLFRPLSQEPLTFKASGTDPCRAVNCDLDQANVFHVIISSSTRQPILSLVGWGRKRVENKKKRFWVIQDYRFAILVGSNGPCKLLDPPIQREDYLRNWTTSPTTLTLYKIGDYAHVELSNANFHYKSNAVLVDWTEVRWSEIGCYGQPCIHADAGDILGSAQFLWRRAELFVNQSTVTDLSPWVKVKAERDVKQPDDVHVQHI